MADEKKTQETLNNEAAEAAKAEAAKAEAAKKAAEKAAETKAKKEAAANKLTKIYSQASNDVVIPTYANKGEKDGKKSQSNNVIEKAIIIKGGANVAFSASNKLHRNTKWAVTEVSAEQLETLKSHKGFMRRVKAGFISIDQEPTELKADKSAQLTEKQVAGKTKAKVETGPVEE